MGPAGDSIREFAGDEAGAAVLREGLAQLAEHHAGTPLGDQMSAVLAGRLSLRELAGDPEFVTMTTDYTRQFSAEWDRLDPDQRRALLEQGDSIMAGIDAEERDER